ncbi:DUF3422 domain-containing protein [Aurantiacibacter poecillastricola]|uniref:DUF3422 domain-containing protein n=1 Tax=Aurantiacibacter poecillastricola TaxID=3064385 RepID=UPI00273E4AA8|nr:DUF3422 domain-containing protein [Aurantiacibacter sp. 219JJ12-13]MDP5260407.1 DUF3422 domain-containing protein [Aurantiacibacter sp. 219JJ12-13]
MQVHPIREQVVREMHLRQWPLLEVPSMVHQWVTLVDPAERGAEAEQVVRHADPVEGDPPHRSGRIDEDISFTWERHSEGSSLTLYSAVSPSPEEDRWAIGDRLAAALEWVAGIPGQIIRATRIYITANDYEATRLLPRLGLDRAELVSCYFEGRARLWSDFRLRDDGFGRLLIAANGENARDLTRAAQRLQELGNYRNKALLGLPAAQAVWPKFDETEQRLNELATRLADGKERDDLLMEELSHLSIDLIAVATRIGYRMSATRAYGRLVDERLSQLAITPIEGFASLTDFTQRRFLPAVRTCAALEDRERQLSERVTRLSSLLRARIETRIENQNADLLRSMERSNAMQVRLQQLVEGLSVVALSYYALGLIAYLLVGLPLAQLGVAEEGVLAVIVVPLVLGVWITVRIAKKRLLSRQE